MDFVKIFLHLKIITSFLEKNTILKDWTIFLEGRLRIPTTNKPFMNTYLWNSCFERIILTFWPGSSNMWISIFSILQNIFVWNDQMDFFRGHNQQCPTSRISVSSEVLQFKKLAFEKKMINCAGIYWTSNSLNRNTNVTFSKNTCWFLFNIISMEYCHLVETHSAICFAIWPFQWKPKFSKNCDNVWSTLITKQLLQENYRLPPFHQCLKGFSACETSLLQLLFRYCCWNGSLFG